METKPKERFVIHLGALISFACFFAAFEVPRYSLLNHLLLVTSGITGFGVFAFTSALERKAAQKADMRKTTAGKPPSA